MAESSQVGQKIDKLKKCIEHLTTVSSTLAESMKTFVKTNDTLEKIYDTMDTTLGGRKQNTVLYKKLDNCGEELDQFNKQNRTILNSIEKISPIMDLLEKHEEALTQAIQLLHE